MYYCNAFFYDIDIFGTSMQMSIGKREKLSTFAGSLISILVGITFICLFFFLGNGLFNKTNPRTSSSISESLTFSRVNMSEKNLTIAIKIQHDGIQDDIFGDIVYYNYMYGKKYYNKTADEYRLFVESSAIESRYRCSESFVKKYNLPNGTYLCLFYFNYHLFGGDSGSPEFEIYQFNLGRCVDCDFPAWASHCNPLSFYRGSATYTIIYQAQIFYPTLLYNPNDYENPISIVYKSESAIIDVNLPKKYKFFFSKTMFEHDIAWIFEDKKQTTYWTIAEFNIQYYYNTDEYLKEPYSSPLLLTISLEMNKKATFYQRSYLKLPEVLSSSFSIIRIILSVVQCVFLFGINKVVKKYTLLNLLYDTNKRGNILNLHNKKSGNLIANLGSSNLSYSNNYLKSPVTTNVLKSPNLSTTVGTPKINKEKNKKELAKLTFKEYMLFSMNSAICQTIKKKDKYKPLITAEQTVSNYYDYQYYTKLIYDIQILKKYVFKDNPYLNILTNYYKKANLWNIQENKHLYEFNSHSHDCIDELNNIKENFNTESFIDSLKKQDDYLFTILRDDVKASIMNLSNCYKKE